MRTALFGPACRVVWQGLLGSLQPPMPMVVLFQFTITNLPLTLREPMWA